MEKSKFRRVHINATIHGNGNPFLAKKTGRNEKCKCGSGKKAKKCCGAETEFYLLKPKTGKEQRL